jgi:hypothetical protein
MTKTFLHGLVQLPTLFKVIRKRKIRQYRDDSRVDEELVDQIVEPAPATMTEAISEPSPATMTEAISEPSPESMAEQIAATSAPKKRGRKPKPKPVTEEEVPVGPGRPTLARNALEADVVPPVLRRSERSKK